MKIALLGLTFPYRGGISHFTTTLYHHLRERHEVELVSFSRLYPKILFPGKTQFDFGASAFKAPSRSKIDTLNPLTWIEVFRFIKRFNPRLALFMWWSPASAPCYFTVAWLMKKARVGKAVYYCHNVFPHEMHWLAKILTRMALASADTLLVHTDRDVETLRRLFPATPVHKLFHPLYDVFPKKGISREEARKTLNVPCRTLLFFGHIRKYKGLQTLIRAMPHVLKEQDCHLVIAGEFYESREKYTDMIASAGLNEHITIHDQYITNDDVEAYFASADIVILPYESASQSGVVQVAYHFDKPVVTTNVGGLPEVVEPGKTGYLVPPGDPRALADAILQFYREKNTVDFKSNIQNFKAGFSWEHLIRMVEKI
ncbi:MAG: glycosyltransferase [Nitrospinales bacterium]